MKKFYFEITERFSFLFRSSSLFLGTLLVLFVFVFLRMVNISESFLFFSDTGRDFLVLDEWLYNGTPPLLGPQNSILPFNQSPVYYYLFMPIYLATGFSLFSTIITNIIFHCLIFVFGVMLLIKEKQLIHSWLVVWLLFSLSPQLVNQHRYIWNPSFVAGCLILSIFTMLLIKEKYSWYLNAIFSLSLALAIGFSYSAIPTAILLLASLSLLVKRNTVFKLLIGFISSIALVHFPLIIFEMRHSFTLTKQLINFENFTQVSTTMYEKFLLIIDMVLTYPNSLLIFWLIVCLALVNIFFTKRNVATNRTPSLLTALILLLLNILFLTVSPISIQPHYIFGVFALFYTLISFLDFRIAIILIILFSFRWLSNPVLESYTSPAWRTVSQTLACANKVCGTFFEPTFVSVQSNMHNYHAAQDFRYLFRKAGCKVFDISQEFANKNEVKHMLVVEDGARYEHNRTKYNELTLFGSSDEIEVIACSPAFKVHILKRS